MKLPIVLGVVMILLLVVITVGWIILTTFTAMRNVGPPALLWTVLAVGTSFLLLILVGVVMYLTLSIKAIHLNQRQANFLDSVTHELKSPIASLRLYLQTLRRQTLNEEERNRFHDMMLADVARLDSLINHLLDAARLQSGGRPQEPEEVELGELLQACAQAVAQRHHFSVACIRWSLVPCTVRAPRHDLEILFRNLIDNAYKYAGAEPEIHISLKLSKKGEAVVQVQDNGKGIPSHLRRFIFGRFVRLGRELERERAGTGLGLYIVNSVIRRLQARIRVQEGPRGRGSVFEITLPAQGSSSPESSGQPLSTPLPSQ